MKRKSLASFLLALILFAGSYLVYATYKEDLKNFITHKIKSEFKEEGISFEVGDIELRHIFSLILHDVHLIGKDSSFKKGRFERVEVSVKFLNLFMGRFYETILFSKGSVSFESSKDSESESYNEMFKDFIKQPFEEFQWKEVLVHWKEKERESKFQIKNLKAKTNYIRSAIYVSGKGSFDLKGNFLERAHPKKGDVEFDLSFFHSYFYISSLALKNGDLSIENRGQVFLKTKSKPVDVRKYYIDSTISGNIKDLSPWVFPEQKDWEGRILLKTSIKEGFFKKPLLFSISSPSLKYKNQNLGKLNLSGKYQDDDVHIEKFVLRKKQGLILGEDLSFGLKDLSARFDIKMNEYPLTQSSEENLSFKKLVSGGLFCKGNYQKEGGIFCRSSLSAKDIRVLRKKENLFSFPRIFLEGSGFFKEGSFSYDLLALDQKRNSLGKLKGHSVPEGHKIFYDLSFPDLSASTTSEKYPLEGSLRFQGDLLQRKDQSWEASSLVKATDLRGGHLFFGNFQANVGVNRRSLFIPNIKGNFKNSHYKGNFAVNWQKTPDLHGRIEFSPLYLEDIRDFLVSEEAPLEISGKVNLKVKIKGPLTSEIKAQISGKGSNLLLNKQSFDSLVLEGRYEKQRLSLNPITLKKQVGIVTGFTHSDKNKVEGQIKIINFPLKETYLGDYFKVPLSGQINGQSQFYGNYKDLEYKTKLQAKRVKIHQSFLPPISMQLNKTKDQYMNDLRIGEDQAIFRFDVDSKKDFLYSLKAQIKDFDLTPIFSLFYPANTSEGLIRSHNLDIDLKARKNWSESLSGNLKVGKIFLGEKKDPITNKEPLDVLFDKGNIKVKNFKLENSSNHLSLFSKKPSFKDLFIKGKLDLKILEWISSEIDSLRGVLNIDLQVKNVLSNPSFFGPLFIEKGFLQPKNFRSPFRNVYMDSLLAEKSIKINQIKGSFAGGEVTSHGDIRYQNSKFIIDLYSDLNDILFSSEGFSSKGGGNFHLKGNSVPYKLTGTYKVHKASLNLDLTDSKEYKGVVKPNEHLPKTYKYQSTFPVALDLDAHLTEPLRIAIADENYSLDTSITGNLKILGFALNPKLKGLLEAQKGGVFTFLKNKFIIENGTLIYKEETFDNPELILTAVTNISSTGKENKEEYEITLKTSGKISNLERTLTSQPSIGKSDIISLLAVGVKTSQIEDTIHSADLQKTGFQLGTAILGKQLGINKTIGDTLGVSFELSTDLLEGGEGTQAKIKKRFNEKLSVSASRALTKNATNNMKVEYNFNKNLSLVGIWREQDKLTSGEQIRTTKGKEKRKVGLDLEYRRYFK